MIKTTRDVYLTEFKNMTFRQRHYYILHNEINIDWEGFKISMNPLRWCLMDLLGVIYFPILILIIYPLLIYPVSFLMAKSLEKRYVEGEDWGWFKSGCKVIE